MTSLIEKKQVIKQILNSKYDRAVCKVCGNYQSHNKIHCSGCGKEFGEKVDILWDALVAANNRQLQKKRVFLRPQYQAAVWKRTLNDADISEKQFEEYVTELLKEKA